MNIHEYQARDILRSHGIPVPAGGVAATSEEAARIAESLGGPVVVKAQVHAGGRGKAGGVKLADDPSAAAEAAGAILGMSIKDVSKELKIPQYRIKAIEESSVGGIQYGFLERYVSFLGLETWFREWSEDNHDLLEKWKNNR